ncbi:MAG: beta-ketoacyl synthase [Xanthomonadales bacterium]|nr:beta-ketoacyl synthase [Xanthomonadales bacterium]
MSIQRLPVIVGFGGINPAGRASGHHAYNRMVHSVLPPSTRERSLSALARLMGVDYATTDTQHLLDHSLIRRIESNHFDVDAVPWNKRFATSSNGKAISFMLKKQNLPENIPENWQVSQVSESHVNVQITGEQNFLLPTIREFEVKAAGQLPTGFDPGKLYPSRSHPRGLQMMVYAASDALGSIGIDFDTILSRISVDEVSVYAGSAMGQLDNAGTGGMLKARYNGRKVSAKNCPLGLAEMPADFINAYVLGTMGSTGASLGACASFLYNLRHGIEDIRSGRSRMAFIGSTETPINPEVMDGYHAMGALASDRGLRQLDGLSQDQQPDYRRACRPFAENCGFTVAESSQMVVLFDDQLAMELGATMFAAPLDVFINADGFKKSIAGPGIGNYITMAKSVASARAILGEKAIRNNGMVQAHGTGTPQNRVTEAHILNETAKAFGIEAWPIAAIKSYLGHSLGSASGDQLTTTLGIWQHGWIPGIHSINGVAADISHDKLIISPDHQQIDPNELHYSVLNSKGFGGNNASAALLSPSIVKNMLQQRYSASDWKAWEKTNESVREQQHAYDERMISGTESPVYKFDHGVLDGDDVQVSDKEIHIAGKPVNLDLKSPYPDIDIK